FPAASPGTSPHRLSRRPAGGSVEGVAAGAGARRVGVVDREALLLDRVDEVDGRAGAVRGAHPVHADREAAEVLDVVAVHLALVEEELVDQAGAAARLHGDTQRKVVTALLLEKVPGLLGGGVGEDDALLRGLLRGLA